MRQLGIVGWPVEHSRSPALHNAVHAELGIDARYDLLPVRPDDLEPTLRSLPGRGWTGVNVTVPHKVAAMDVCDELTPEAALVGAVNTLHFTGGATIGDNTDARGWLASLHEGTDWEPGAAAVVLGTGGAARAVVVALGRDGADVVVVGRRETAVADLAGLAVRAGGRGTGVVLSDESVVRRAVATARLVVNATPLGMHGEHLPEPLLGVGRSHIAADLVYTPSVTPFLQHAARAGATPLGGLGMLVHQAALSFARWHDVDPPIEAFWRAARTGRPS